MLLIEDKNMSFQEPVLELINEDNSTIFIKKSMFLEMLNLYCHSYLITEKYLFKIFDKLILMKLNDELKCLSERFSRKILPKVKILPKAKIISIRNNLQLELSFEIIDSVFFSKEDLLSLMKFIQIKFEELNRQEDKIFQLYLYQLVDPLATLEFNSESGQMELKGNIKDFKADKILEYLKDNEEVKINDKF